MTNQLKDRESRESTRNAQRDDLHNRNTIGNHKNYSRETNDLEFGRPRATNSNNAAPGSSHHPAGVKRPEFDLSDVYLANEQVFAILSNCEEKK